MQTENEPAIGRHTGQFSARGLGSEGSTLAPLESSESIERSAVSSQKQDSSRDFSSAGGGGRAKSALRLRYEAEALVIERKLGDLESIRDSLGLSQRKMAQLLLVDPSAWTRWTKGGDEAPPHIYRMLQWYLALEEKYPALDVKFWLQTVTQLPDQTSQLVKLQRNSTAELSSLLESAHNRISKLEAQLAVRAVSNLKRLLLFGAGVWVGTLLMWWRFVGF